MAKGFSLDDLWNSASPGDRAFQPDIISSLPEPARRYLEHAIAPGTQLSSAVRLRMHGEIKRWLPFTAEQVIVRDRGFIWSATVRMNGMPIRGFDRLVDGEGSMRWRLFGIIPVMTASGPDITRSAAGRVAGEAVWLPSALCDSSVSWTATDSSRLHAKFTTDGHESDLECRIDDRGRIESLKMQRWGNPDGRGFRHIDFGCFAENEGTFNGYTIPTRLRVGWYFDTPRFETEGEFFRCTIDSAEFR
ncbi:MAG: DUF6544 family protein [Chloroflexota bacterium]|nr:DUF6544 family protein [Chloroflexota bacterium]